MENETPTIFEWMGGRPVLRRLLKKFYAKVEVDEMLAPLFKHMPPDHHEHVAMWFEEVLGGEPLYTEERGGFKNMIKMHRGRAIKPEQRDRWVELMMETVEEVDLPQDPEFRAAFVGYIEFGSRRALSNSQPGAPMPTRETILKWGWGVAPPGTP
ncbi:group II truncated hemoglobin [Algicola sagamiensis]|uniref:group II truncated hemoglobin n=1 Tax=Algicola sagamiensis TaxID=163869 RepID=UPI00036D220D|nr:group II truncated hemoglobin [Algicola sagamiensis]